MPPPPERQKTTIIAISGPSSSGKTTLARLLQRIFSKLTPQATNTNTNLRTFIVHEDDFYHPDDKIPLIPHPRDPTTQIQNWDTLSALDIPFLSASLSYIHAHGHLPPRLRSKEDLNDVAESGVSEEVVSRMREVVRGRVPSYFLEDNTNSVSGDGVRTIVFLEGFLLFAPPKEEDPRHGLRDVQEKMDVRLFLPARYDNVKERREGRSGYVTIGPAPVQQGGGGGEGGGGTELPQRGSVEVDLEEEDDRPPQSFWEDPPGYVDDIVWPNYVQDHAWLLLPEGEEGSAQTAWKDADTQELVRLVGQGVNLRLDTGVTVAPGQGKASMTDILEWAVEEVLKHIAETEGQ
ncbi:nicotinamide riboside kinase [Aspergillus awamori]|uniref:Nicotinamide riboside kinase 1 n=2 Tax=Aspergillus TaxID=5052 RepID=A0A3F3PP78_9EURO|nr:nicotinamide riboside kinase 1 [Aspergillus welwitschiae]RDH28737.1 nicotinamide riboside kinase 1 [Aspergillus welwitschiae]GCB23612.1 nicotinamide riboside kinase [Aspergillus awamori]GKZ57001.1 nicotinamide riboside kinase [Aspergillus niger]